MIKFKEDIIQKLKMDFDNSSDSAIEILQEGITNADYLEKDRIIRCIIYLSKGNLNDLKRYLEIAKDDPRDVMLNAEYEKLDDIDFNFKRVRDLSKTFDKCEI